MLNGAIAVFMNEVGVPASLSSAKQIAVYENKDGSWSAMREIYVNFGAITDMTALRSEVKKLAAELGECRITAGSKMNGIIYRELNSLGFSIFEIDQVNAPILDGILSDIKEAEYEENNSNTEVLRPVETETPGVFSFDLIRYQQQFPERSSKQALKEFLQNTPFFELKLTCSHIPPWLEKDYQIETEHLENAKYIATIRNKQCGVN